jgi:hypothetical protein
MNLNRRTLLTHGLLASTGLVGLGGCSNQFLLPNPF